MPCPASCATTWTNTKLLYTHAFCGNAICCFTHRRTRRGRLRSGDGGARLLSRMPSSRGRTSTALAPSCASCTYELNGTHVILYTCYHLQDEHHEMTAEMGKKDQLLASQSEEAATRLARMQQVSNHL